LASNPGDVAGDFHIYDNNVGRRVLGYNRASNQLLLGAAGTSMRMPPTVWHVSSDGTTSNNRFFFNTGGSTLFGSPDGYIWRNAANTNILDLSNSGLLTVNSLNIGQQTLQQYIQDVSGSSTDITANTATIGTGSGSSGVIETGTLNAPRYPSDAAKATSNTFTSVAAWGAGNYTVYDHAGSSEAYRYLQSSAAGPPKDLSVAKYNSAGGAYIGANQTVTTTGTILGDWWQILMPTAIFFNNVNPGTTVGTGTCVVSNNGSTWVVAGTWSSNVYTNQLATSARYTWWRLIYTSYGSAYNGPWYIQWADLSNTTETLPTYTVPLTQEALTATSSLTVTDNGVTYTMSDSRTTTSVRQAFLATAGWSPQAGTFSATGVYQGGLSTTVSPMQPGPPPYTTSGEWIQIQMPQTVTVQKVTLRFTGSSPAFDMLVSPNGNTWYYLIGSGISGDTVTMAPTLRYSAQYYRIVMRAFSGSTVPQIYSTKFWVAGIPPSAYNDEFLADCNANISGNLLVGGSITATGYVTAFSDFRLKKNVQPIDDATTLVRRLKGVRFDWKQDGRPAVGMIAQEVQQVLPEVVYENGQGEGEDGPILSLAYGNLVGLLVEGLKAVLDRLDAVEARLSEAENRG